MLLIGYSLSSCISIAGSSIALTLAFVLAIIRFIKQSKSSALDKGMIIAIAIFFFTLLVSAITSDHVALSLKSVWGDLRHMAPLFLVTVFIKDRKKMKAILFALCVSIFIADSYAIWQGIQGKQRVAAFGAHPMILAGYLIQMIPLLLVMVAEGNILGNRSRIILAIIFLLSLIALVLNGTRGAWLAVVFIFFVYGIMSIKRNRYIVPCLVIILIIASLTISVVPTLHTRAKSITDHNFQSNTERILLWKSAWNMFSDHPLTGIGPGGFAASYKRQYILPAAKEPKLTHAHNNFIHIAAEAGTVGLVGFLYMFGSILYTSLRQYRVNNADAWAMCCFLATVSLLVQGFTEYNFGNSAVCRLYWFIVGLMTVSGNIYINESKAKGLK